MFEFTTKNLILEPLTLKHALGVQRHFADWEVVQYLSDVVPWPYPEDGALTYIRDVVAPVQGKGEWHWAIVRKEEPDEAIGSICLRANPGETGNRGFWLGRKFWGRGWMTEAVIPLNDFAFAELGFATLQFANVVGNTASRRIKEKTGAKYIKTIPGNFVDHQHTEQEVWLLTQAEWGEKRQTLLAQFPYQKK